MPRIDVRRLLALLLLLLILTPVLSWAEQPTEPRNQAARGRLLTTLWNFVKAAWEQEGASLDPDCQPRPNGGASLDPDGSTADEGGFIDPDG